MPAQAAESSGYAGPFCWKGTKITSGAIPAPKGLQDLARGFNPGTGPQHSAAPCKGARSVRSISNVSLIESKAMFFQNRWANSSWDELIVALFQGASQWGNGFPWLKPRAKSCSPFGARPSRQIKQHTKFT